MSPSDGWRRAGEIFSGMLGAVASYFERLVQTASVFRRLMPLGRAGWAISTYGIMLAPGQHKAAAEAISELDRAGRLLEDAWSDAAVREAICSLVPWLYAPDQRDIGWERKRLLERASDRFTEGLYEEAVLLVYSQLDGLFHDRADTGDEAFNRLFSRRPVRTRGSGANVRQFVDIVTETETMVATEAEFFLVVRELLTESVGTTTLDDHPSRHGVLHGRVLGYGTRLRAAQAFAFLAACLEILVASLDPLPLSHQEAYETPAHEAPQGLQLILDAMAFMPVRSVYIQSQATGHDALLAIEQSEPEVVSGEDAGQ